MNQHNVKIDIYIPYLVAQYNYNMNVKIMPYQLDHFKKVVEILRREHGYVDVSPFGAGKTHIAFAIAAVFKMNMMVICPKTAMENWRKWGERYNINIVRIMTYQGLRGVKSSELNHPYLERDDNDEYTATEEFERCVNSSLLLVFDEFHNVKNENSQLHAAHALVKSVVRLVKNGAKARIALLSATPADKKEYVSSIFKMLGIINSDKLYHYNRGSKKYIPLGIKEAIDKCNQYDPDTTFHISTRTINKTTAKIICHRLYKDVLKKYFTSSMPSPPITVEKDARNLYAIMPQADVKRLEAGTRLFSAATNFDESIKEVNYSGTNWGDVTASRMEIDASKISTMARLAQENLRENPHCKVVLFCNYVRDIKRLEQLLAIYNPLVMYGATSDTNRKDAISKFQEDNDEYRVIIANVKVGGVSIDLDDKFGGRPRIMYILPSYNFIDQYQATGRIYRKGTKSDATIRFLYSKEFPYETGILNSMAMKSNVARDMVTDVQDSVKFPGEYDAIIEE